MGVDLQGSILDVYTDGLNTFLLLDIYDIVYSI